jgi:hypothetical protein
VRREDLGKEAKALPLWFCIKPLPAGGKTATAKGWSTAFSGSLQPPRNSGRIYFGGATRKISRR